MIIMSRSETGRTFSPVGWPCLLAHMPCWFHPTILVRNVPPRWKAIFASLMLTVLFTQIASLGREGPKDGDDVWVRARVANVRGKGGSAFLVLRAVDGSSATVQACLFKTKEDPEGSKKMINFLQDLTQETIVDIQATLANAEVRSCTQDSIELQIKRCVPRALWYRFFADPRTHRQRSPRLKCSAEHRTALS